MYSTLVLHQGRGRMLAILAVVFGGDARALRVARGFTAIVMWCGPLEVRRLIRTLEELIDEELKISRAA